MFKNLFFYDALIWLAITAITVYLGLTAVEGVNAFLYGAWSGINFANFLLRFKKAYDKEKNKSAK